MKVRYARVRFREESQYTYDYLCATNGLKIDDRVVIETANGPEVGYFVEYIKENDLSTNKHGGKLRWILGEVDFSEYKLNHYALLHDNNINPDNGEVIK